MTHQSSDKNVSVNNGPLISDNFLFIFIINLTIVLMKWYKVKLGRSSFKVLKAL